MEQFMKVNFDVWQPHLLNNGAVEKPLSEPQARGRPPTRVLQPPTSSGDDPVEPAAAASPDEAQDSSEEKQQKEGL